jgi:hypothetical protein
VDNVSDVVSSLDGKSNDAIVFEDMGVLEIGDSDAMVVDDDNAIQDNLSLVSRTPEAIPHASESDGLPTSTDITPSYLALPPASDHDKPLIHPTVTSSKTVLASTLSAQKKGVSKVIMAAPGYLDMSKFVVKIPLQEWVNKDVETSRKRRLVLEDRRVAIEETKRDLEERALVKKRAGQNERQKKHRAKMVEKEIAKGIRDDDGKIRKKRNISEISVQLSCHCR